MRERDKKGRNRLHVKGGPVRGQTGGESHFSGTPNPSSPASKPLAPPLTPQKTLNLMNSFIFHEDTEMLSINSHRFCSRIVGVTHMGTYGVKQSRVCYSTPYSSSVLANGLVNNF